MKTQSKDAFNKILQSLRQGSPTKQLLLGSASGWATGFVTVKVGKTAALAVGSGIILFQLAQNQGLVKATWDDVRDKAQKMSNSPMIRANGPNALSKVKAYARGNIPFTAGFVGGVLVGLAT